MIYFDSNLVSATGGDGPGWRGARRVNLLISDTGGGHRACANALRAAMIEQEPGIEVEIVDGLRETGRFPIDRMPELYTRWSERRNLWRTTFYLTNGRRWSKMLFYPWQQLTKTELSRAILRGRPDVVVAMHPCLTAAAQYAVRKTYYQPYLATVVTDLFYGHASWFTHGADAYFVPTATMRERALRQRIPENLVQVSGLPLNSRLSALRGMRPQLRRRLGFNKPTVVCVGGADGMGIHRLFPALAELPSDIDVHIVCGKNEELRERLARTNPPANIHLHGFTSELPEMLAAADLALIKASPTVLMEALTVGTYVLIYDFVPGQEFANVEFVQENGLGDYSRSPKKIARKIREFCGREAIMPVDERAIDFVPRDGATRIAKHILFQSQSRSARLSFS
jgi:1,2-diacylglycerol 3-beta-galactosyltransferase